MSNPTRSVGERPSLRDVSILPMDWAAPPTQCGTQLGAVLVIDPVIGEIGAHGGQRCGAVLGCRATGVLRLRQRLARSRLGTTAWVSDPAFDPARHVYVDLDPLPAPGGRAEVAARAAQLLAGRLRRDRPLWELHILHGCADGAVVVVAKFHPALLDALRAILFGGTGTADSITRNLPVGAGAGRDVRWATPRPRPPRPVAGLAAGISRLVAPLQSLLDPTAVMGDPTHDAGWAEVGSTGEQGHRLVMVRLDLDQMRRIRDLHGGTVDDVLLTVLSGGLRSWLTERGQPPRRPLRVLLPQRPPHFRATAATRVDRRLPGDYLLALPTDEPEPWDRFYSIRGATIEHAAGSPAHGPGAVALLTALLPALLRRRTAPVLIPVTVPVMARLINTVIAADPIPVLASIAAGGLSVAGSPLREIYPVVPVAAGQTLTVSISSYRDVHVALHANRPTIPDLDRLGHHLTAALAELTGQ